jgi:hypothetical protein
MYPNAYAEGQAAFQAGKFDGANPYHIIKSRDLWKEWHKGWFDAYYAARKLS